MGSHDTHRTLTHLIRACDVVFGSTSLLIAGIATVQWLAGEVGLGLVLALWAVPVANISWSLVTKHRDRAWADLARGVACVPLASFIYGAEDHGLLATMWLPALMLSVAVCLSVGIGKRRLILAIPVAGAYAFGIVVAGGFDEASIIDAAGLFLTDTILSIVAVQLGHSLVDATRRRDEAHDQRARAEAALAELKLEMARRRQVEAELVQAQKLESVGRLAAGVAHEINTPVQFVGDSLQFVREAIADLLACAQHSEASSEVDLDYLIQEVPQAIERAQHGLDRVATIVRSMKVFAHRDSDGPATTDLNRAIEATLIVARNEYRYVADLVIDFDPQIPPVWCFASELNQAVLNLVVNAAHAIGDAVAGTTARGVIEVRTKLEDDAVVIAVRDTGTGIPAEMRDRVFDPFFTTKEVGKGTGQGLAIARSVVVDKHHGQLWFDTEVGRGTTFFIRIPIDGRARLAA